MQKPSIKPINPCFSSGPCPKRPGWNLDDLRNSFLAGRSHRSSPGKKQLKDIIDRHRNILGIPDDYRVAITPASDTGALEMAMWNIIGTNPAGTEVLAWESFSNDWVKDIEGQLKPEPLKIHSVEYGRIPDLSAVDFDRDVVFVWNGTTSGVRVPDGQWIDKDRKGLTICDATSAMFVYDMPWDKLDVVTWSWQKALGSEGAHGMLVLSPRAAERITLAELPASRPLPKIFRLKKGKGLNEGVFEGLTINTPSMLAVADCLDALKWVESIGGQAECSRRSFASFNILKKWVERTSWVEFLPEYENITSQTSVCLKIVSPEFIALSEKERIEFVTLMAKILEREEAAYDIKSYRDAPAGLRIWCGSTVESDDVEKLLPWLDWAYSGALDNMKA